MDVNRAIRALEKRRKVWREEGGRRCLAAANRTAEAARARCPVDTGRLRASIRSAARGPLASAVWTDCEYARAVEYGTSDRPAQPFLLPAAHSAGGERS